MAYSRVACLVLAFAMLATHIVDAAIPCPRLKQRLYPCTVYLKNKSGDSGSCCHEVRMVNNALKTKVDRQTACKCILQEVHDTRGLDVNRLAKLPQTCRVSIRGYIVRQHFNCNSIS
ncbi:hypothetical protein MRB53_002751 [Persea americana]|uniref:Uncharacterized protein n=1 Tax=Persea americana TaxID=3435 RepID=A0ACC2MW38_PERAE|nr:hypothetical protein MRB53_002751 [Persea americana]